jgi:hypothetical protein
LYPGQIVGVVFDAEAACDIEDHDGVAAERAVTVVDDFDFGVAKVPQKIFDTLIQVVACALYFARKALSDFLCVHVLESSYNGGFDFIDGGFFSCSFFFVRGGFFVVWERDKGEAARKNDCGE